MEGASIYGCDPARVDRSLKLGDVSIMAAVLDSQISRKRVMLEGDVARLAFCNLDLPAFRSASTSLVRA
jgi:DNA polymerase V